MEKSMVENNADITDKLINIITEMTSATMPNREITAETYLGADLQLKSLDFIRMVSAVNQQFDRQNIPFQELFIAPDGSILEDIQIKQVAEFLAKHL